LRRVEARAADRRQSAGPQWQERHMTAGEFLYLILVVVAAGAFMGTLFWVSRSQP
jgi:hypothetical protein